MTVNKSKFRDYSREDNGAENVHYKDVVRTNKIKERRAFSPPNLKKFMENGGFDEDDSEE